MHVICHGFAPLMGLVSLNETSGEWIILLEFVISSGLIVTENTGDCQVFRSSIEDNLGWLTVWRSHVHGTKIDSIVSAGQWDLELEIISIVLRCISDFTDKLRNMNMCSSSSLTLVLSLNHIVVLDILSVGLGEASDLFLSKLSVVMFSLEFSELGIVHFITINEDFLVSGWSIWAIDDKINVGALLKLKAVDVLNIFSFQIDSDYRLTIRE